MIRVLTGSSANPYIKNPRDTEYVDIYDTYEEAKQVPFEHNVHKTTMDYVSPRWFIWSYLFHYINRANGTTLTEAPLETLVAIANGIINSSRDKKTILKSWYHVAMVKAIEKYGYDDIPETIAQQINDLHDLKMPYSQFDLDK